MIRADVRLALAVVLGLTLLSGLVVLTGGPVSTNPMYGPPDPRTFLEPGYHWVGADAAPGVYAAPGGPGCWWEVVAADGPHAVKDSGGGTGIQLVRLEPPTVSTLFDSDGCGPWVPQPVS